MELNNLEDLKTRNMKPTMLLFLKKTLYYLSCKADWIIFKVALGLVPLSWNKVVKVYIKLHRKGKRFFHIKIMLTSVLLL